MYLHNVIAGSTLELITATIIFMSGFQANYIGLKQRAQLIERMMRLYLTSSFWSHC